MGEDNKKNNHEGNGHHSRPQRPIDDVSADTYSWWKKNYVLIKKTSIRTWRGVFLLAFIIGAAVALIWTISTNIHQFLKAEGETATMSLTAEPAAVVVGENVMVDITLDTNESAVVAARAIVNYDPADLELTGCSTDTEATAFYPTTESCLETMAEQFRIINNEESGIFDITMAKPTPGVNGDGVLVATLTFKALKVAAGSNITLTYASDPNGNYTDSDVILDNRQGTDILNGVTATSVIISAAYCDDWRYTDWGACQSGSYGDFDGHQTRDITQYIPEGCINGGVKNPDTIQGCVMPPSSPEPPTSCDVSLYKYSEYTACQVTNIKTRTVITSSPVGCNQNNATTVESCVYIDPKDGKPISGENIDIDDPKIKVGNADKVKLKNDKKFYSKEAKLKFKGKISGLDGGSVKAYVDGDLDEEVKLNNKGEWSYSKKGKNGKTYDLKFAYLNSKGQEVDNSSKYEVKIDTESPKFTDLPLSLNKSRGSKIWWKTEDNSKIDYFTIEFNGKKKKTDNSSFVVSADTPRGMHWLVVKAYDKAGNKETRRVLIRVR